MSKSLRGPWLLLQEGKEQTGSLEFRSVQTWHALILPNLHHFFKIKLSKRLYLLELQQLHPFAHFEQIHDSFVSPVYWAIKDGELEIARVCFVFGSYCLFVMISTLSFRN
jgi:hypothetical protein